MYRLYEAAEHTVKAGAKPEPGSMDTCYVSDEFVRHYITVESRRLLLSGGGSEEMRKTKTGVITIKSTNPDKTECRVVRFTPVSGNGGV